MNEIRDRAQMCRELWIFNKLTGLPKHGSGSRA